MRRLLLLFLLAGCGPVTLNPFKSEFWLGGTDDKEIREKAAPIIKGAEADVAKYGPAFIDCMKRYGASHSTVKATGFEVAEAGIASCTQPLDAFTSAYATAMEYTWYSVTGAKPEASRGPIYGRDEAQKARAELSATGRQAALKALVDAQKP